MMKDKFKMYFMEVAELTSKLSHANKLKVGSVAVKDGRIIGCGYNGNNIELDLDECEDVIDGELITKSTVLHSEENLIAYLARNNESSKDAILFCNVLPCIKCARLIVASGFKAVYYRNMYRDNSSIEFFNKCGIHIERL
jgi:dCMP deaminase